jgi:DUF1680 family protein
MRGSVVYCVESADISASVESLLIPPDAEFQAEFQPDELDGVVVLRGKVSARASESDGLPVGPTDLNAVPFYVSANREPCPMRVWLPSALDGSISDAFPPIR